MIRKLLALIVASTSLLSQRTHAQNISPYWSLAGNSNANTSSKLGTTNGIPLRLLTNNVERIRIDPAGKIGIGTTVPRGKLTLFNTGSIPTAAWAPTSAIFTGFAENTAGSGDYFLAMASNTRTTRPNILVRRARGTLAAPLAVVDNDYITSFQASGYDGSAFQNPANIDFFADGTPSPGNVPVRISFTTGSNISNRQERLKIGSTGNIAFNSSQLYIDYASGNVGIGTLTPFSKLLVQGTIFASVTNAIGIHGYSYGSVGNGVVGYAEGSYSTGVYGSGATGVYGYTSSAGYAGYFIGSVYTTGNYQGSDSKLKQNITDFSGAMNIIDRLRPKIYEYRQEGNYKMMNLPNGKRYGLIAQDVEELLPSLIKVTEFNTRDAMPSEKRMNKDETNMAPPSERIDFKALNYTELIPIIIKGMQEQQIQIQEQQKQIEDLKALVNKLLQNQTITKGAISLFQNTPNPVKGTTRISYNIPQDTRNAHLLITDAIGRTIKTLPLSTSGVLDFDSSNLSAGVYNYSIVIDNKTIETKKMTVRR